MATRGNSTNIIVGAAQLFTYNSILDSDSVPTFEADKKYSDTLADVGTEQDPGPGAGFRNVGYTMNGLELVFQPDFGEVQVDQILDVAKLYKQGMQVNLNTAFAEATLENLLFSIAGQDSDLTDTTIAVDKVQTLTLGAGDIGECPVERSLIAVGPGTGDCAPDEAIERVYVAYRALSIENVTVSAKRDEPTMFEVSFRLLPDDASSSYGKIVDRALSYDNTPSE
jgi:hypothetical protein